MRVKITEVHFSSGGVQVSFSTQYGLGKGFWFGADPVTGHEYHVEIDIDDNLAWGVEVKPCTSKDVLIRADEKSLIICGYLEDVDENGVAAIRLGDSIISFVSKGLREHMEQFVTVATRNASLYQYDL